MFTPELSIVIPVHNEAATLSQLFAALLPVASAIDASFELIVVNDGSSDNSLLRLLELQRTVPQLRILDFSRNFGKEAALMAGLQHARGRCAITMDADLQDPPELIPQMVQKWRQGYETVIAVHQIRTSDALARRTATRWFYRLINWMSEVPFVADAGDYRLLDRLAIDAFLSLDERTRFNKGLFAWIGFRSCLIEHARPMRSAGESKFNFRRLFAFAIDGITSFSSFPLRICTYLGISVAIGAFLYGGFIVLHTLILGVDVPGYASLLVAVMFLGGVNLLGIGILGEYIGRIFIESKGRPLYVLRQIHEPNSNVRE